MAFRFLARFLLACLVAVAAAAPAQDGTPKDRRPPRHEQRELRGPRDDAGPDRSMRQQMRRLFQLRMEGERIAAGREARRESERELADAEVAGKRGKKWVERQTRLNELRAQVEAIEVEDYLERVQRETSQTLARLERRRAELAERGEEPPPGWEWHERRLRSVADAAAKGFDALMAETQRGPDAGAGAPESDRLERLAEERLFIMRRLMKLNEELGLEGSPFQMPPGTMPPDERMLFPGANGQPPRGEMLRDRGRK